MKRALLFSGGISPKQNRLSYRGDLCAFYKLLREVYGYAKEEIRVYWAGGGSYDFDGDGQPETHHVATRERLRAGLSWLSSLGAEDTLVFMATNHGHPTGLYPWGPGSPVTPREFEVALAPCRAKKLLIFGQCYSGVFGQMKLDQAVICCACGDAEKSYPVPIEDIEPPYDEYLYHLVGALAGRYPDGEPLSAGGDPAPMSIAEAHYFATRQDRTGATPILFGDEALAAVLCL